MRYYVRRLIHLEVRTQASSSIRVARSNPTYIQIIASSPCSELPLFSNVVESVSSRYPGSRYDPLTGRLPSSSHSVVRASPP